MTSGARPVISDALETVPLHGQQRWIDCADLEREDLQTQSLASQAGAALPVVGEEGIKQGRNRRAWHPDTSQRGTRGSTTGVSFQAIGPH